MNDGLTAEKPFEAWIVTYDSASLKSSGKFTLRVDCRLFGGWLIASLTVASVGYWLLTELSNETDTSLREPALLKSLTLSSS